MKKNETKMKLLKKLMEMMQEDSRSPEDHMYPEKKMKATIMADSKEGLLEGAKKLPEALNKAEEYRKMRMSSKEEK
jgi:hypothetical protein